MDESTFDRSVRDLAASTARRDALRSLSAAGMALLAALGLGHGGDAKQKHHHHGGSKQHRASGAHAEKKHKCKRKPGPTGPTGPTGPAGGTGSATGPTGPTGAAGPLPTITQVQGEDQECGNGDVVCLDATCPGASVAIGGGFNSTAGSAYLNKSQRTDPQTWQTCVGCGDDDTITAFVICLAAS